jgi:hypothetical protein
MHRAKLSELLKLRMTASESMAIRRTHVCLSSGERVLAKAEFAVVHREWLRRGRRMLSEAQVDRLLKSGRARRSSS